MKHAVLPVCICLLTLGGLYHAFFLQDPETTNPEVVARTSKAIAKSGSPTIESEVIRSSLNGKVSRKNPQAAEDETAEAQGRVGTTRPQPEPLPQVATPEVQSSRDERNALRPADAASTEQAADTVNQQVRPPVGIRLAPDVRLPVAAMPNDLKLNPIKQKVLQDIVDEFYRTVAAVPDTESGSKSGTTVIEENGEQTRIITNSPAVNSARMRADLRFKALFGHAAYNRMTMNTLLESRLPQVSAEQ